MKNTFSDLISGHGFERHFNNLFLGLSDQGVDYRHVYSGPDITPAFLRIDLDNRQNMTRITIIESGSCRLENVSFKGSTPMTTEDLEFTSLEAFEAKLVELIQLMKDTRQPH